jgi:type II secretory pathway pseudopilin PulG
VRTGSSGFTLVEALVAMLLLALGLLAAVPLFTQAMHGADTAGALASAAAAAEDRLELLRATNYGGLPAGGSLSSDVTGYFDTPHPDVVVRWQVVDNVSPPSTKTITVRAVQRGSGPGPARRVELVTLRGD